MRARLPILATALALAGALALSSAPASAHERTTSGVDVTTDVVVAPDGVTVVVAAHLGETAAAPEMRRLDADGDGRVDDAERAAFERTLGDRVRAAVTLSVQDEPTGTELDGVTLTVPLGPTGLPELALRARLRAPWAPDLRKAPPASVSLTVHASPWPDAPGHREVIVSGRPTGSVRYKLLRTDPKGHGAKGHHVRVNGATIRYALREAIGPDDAPDDAPEPKDTLP